MSAIVRDFAVSLRLDQLPAGDLTVQVDVVGDSETIHKFILLRDGKVQVCEDNIGHDVDVYLTADIGTLGKILYGDCSVESAKRMGLMRATGTPYYVRTMEKWLEISQFAEFNRNSPSTAHGMVQVSRRAFRGRSGVGKTGTRRTWRLYPPIPPPWEVLMTGSAFTGTPESSHVPEVHWLLLPKWIRQGCSSIRCRRSQVR